MMLKIIVVFFLAWPAFAWASCVTRLEGSHPSLAYIIEHAVNDGTLTSAEFERFTHSPIWYNPFRRAHESVLRDRYRDLFAEHDSGSNEAERMSVKQSLKILSSARAVERKIGEAAAEATATVLSPRWLRTIAFPGDEKFRDGVPRATLIWRGGRPVFYSPREANEGPVGLLYDPFAEREELRVQSFSIGKRLSEAITPFSVDGHSFAAMLTHSTVLDLEKLEDATARFEGNLWGLSKSSSVFANTRTNPILVQERDAYRVAPAQPRPDSIALQSLPVDSLKFGANDVEGGSIAWSVNQTSIEFHPFTEAFDSLLPIQLSKLGDRAEINSLRLFPVRGKLYAAILFSVPQLQEIPGWSMQVTRNRHMALVELGSGKIVARKKLGTVDNELVTNFRIGKFQGKEKIYFAHRDREWNQHLYFVNTEEIDDIKSEEIQNFNGDLTSFKLRGNEVLVWHDDKRITVFEHDTGQRLFLDFVCSRMAAHLEIFDYQGNTYLFARPYARQGQLYQLTSASRSPQSVPTGSGNSCDESRLTHPHHSLTALLELAVAQGVWTGRQFEKFANGEDWTNPFNKTSDTLLTSRFQEIYDSTIAGMGPAQLRQERLDLHAAAAKRAGANLVALKADHATESVLAAARILPGFNEEGASASVALPSKITLFEGRPVILRPMFKKIGRSRKWGMVLLNPFHPDVDRRGLYVEDDHASFDLAADFFELDGSLYAGGRGFAVNLADRSRDLRLATPETIIDNGSRIVRTHEGPALLRGQSPHSRLLAKTDGKWLPILEDLPANYKLNLVHVFSLPSRDIVALIGPRFSHNYAHFVDLSREEFFSKFDLTKIAKEGDIFSVRIFENRGELFAVIGYNIPFNGAYYLVLNLRTGLPVADPVPTSIGTLDIVKIEGEPWILNHLKDQKKIEIFTPKVKYPHIIPVTGLQSTARAFRFRDHDYLVWATADGLTLCDPSDWSLTDLPLPNFANVHGLQILNYEGNVYVVADVTDRAPMLIRLTNPSR